MRRFEIQSKNYTTPFIRMHNNIQNILLYNIATICTYIFTSPNLYNIHIYTYIHTNVHNCYQETLKWEPKYKSFRTFMRRLGGEDIADPVKKPKKDKASVLWLPGGDDDDDF